MKRYYMASPGGAVFGAALRSHIKSLLTPIYLQKEVTTDNSARRRRREQAQHGLTLLDSVFGLAAFLQQHL